MEETNNLPSGAKEFYSDSVLVFIAAIINYHRLRDLKWCKLIIL